MASSGSPGTKPLPARSRATSAALLAVAGMCCAHDEPVRRTHRSEAASARAVLERVERHSPVSVDGVDFAINHRLSGHCLASAGDLREARREQIAAPRPKHNAAAAPRRKASVAVKFGLIAPGGAAGSSRTGEASIGSMNTGFSGSAVATSFESITN